MRPAIGSTPMLIVGVGVGDQTGSAAIEGEP
jgi:hypothetical protein